MLFKLSNLNSNLALTLGYLKPALNNSALENLETLVMQNSEGENKVRHGLYESSDYKRCKASVN